MFSVLIGSVVAIHVERIGDVPPELEKSILGELERSLAELAEKRAIFDRNGGVCDQDPACLAAIRARLATDDVLLVRLVGGPLRVHAIAARFAPRVERDPARVELDLARGATTWRPDLDELVRRLFPDSIEYPPLSLPVAPPKKTEEEGRSIAPWIAFGASAAMLAAGLALGAKSRSAIDSIEESPRTPGELDHLASRASSHARAANILFAGAATGAAIGAAIFVFE